MGNNLFAMDYRFNRIKNKIGGDKVIKSRYGIYYNTSDSDIFEDYEDLRFYFSSTFNKEKFKKLCKFYVESENAKLINRNKIDIDLSYYFMISLYQSIESRGFKIISIKKNVELVNSRFINLKFKTIIEGI